jgi:predicted transposase YbfD/YdcC
VLGGARSEAAIAQCAAKAAPGLLLRLGAWRCRRTDRIRVPVASTIGRLLSRIDGDALDRALGAWITALGQDGVEQEHPEGLAADGKTVRGAKDEGQSAPHLLAAVRHTDATVLAPRQVDAKSNEITAFEDLLNDVDIRGLVITADALHTQRSHAQYLLARGAHYLLYAKGNQPTLHFEIEDYNRAAAPVRHTEIVRAHGRTETRTLKILIASSEVVSPDTGRSCRSPGPACGAGAMTRSPPSNTPSQTWALVTPPLPNLPRSCAGTGAWRPCTTCATPPTPRTPAGFALPRPRAPWPACATPPSACCAYAAGRTSPPQTATRPPTPTTLHLLALNQ